MPKVAETLDEVGEDRNAVLFGTATISLTLIAVVLGVLSFFGWASIRDKVEFEVERKLEGVRVREVAESQVASGAIYGVLAEYFVAKHAPGFLIESAIMFSNRALSVEEIKGSPTELKAKNNLAYQLALRSSLGEPRRGDAKKAMEMAREVWATTGSGDPFRSNKAMTLGRVTAEFAAIVEPEPARCLRDTIALMESVSKEETLDTYSQTEMDITYDRLRLALAKVRQEPSQQESLSKLAKRAWRAFRQGRLRT